MQALSPESLSEVKTSSETEAELARNKQLNEEMHDLIQSLIQGDYTVKANIDHPLGRSMQQLIDKLCANAQHELNHIVDLSINTNEASIASAQLLYDLQNVDNFAQSIATAAEEMRSSVEQVTEYSNSIDEGTTKSLQTAQQVSVHLDDAIKAFENIQNAVMDNSSKLTTMSEFTKQVRDIADQIKGIAFQTNLLSLNASVEAARAGTHGAGFGVVAQEMRLLSNSSESATKEITNLVSNYEREIQNITKSLDNSVSIVNDGQQTIGTVSNNMTSMITEFQKVSEHTTQISHALSEQRSASNEVADGINTVAAHTSHSAGSTDTIVDRVNTIQSHINDKILIVQELTIPKKVIKLAQSDHVIWKKRLVNMIAGKEGLNSGELADHHGCRLGKWYDQVKEPELLQHPSFKALIEPHKQVHHHGIKAVDLYNNGQVAEALEEIELVEAASIKVLALLDELARS